MTAKTKVKIGVIVLLVVLVLVVMVNNSAPAALWFLGMEFHPPVWAVILFSAAFGFVMGYLTCGFRRWRKSRAKGAEAGE